jgi:hypothetical protein
VRHGKPHLDTARIQPRRVSIRIKRMRNVTRVCQQISKSGMKLWRRRVSLNGTTKISLSLGQAMLATPDVAKQMKRSRRRMGCIRPQQGKHPLRTNPVSLRKETIGIPQDIISHRPTPGR